MKLYVCRLILRQPVTVMRKLLDMVIAFACHVAFLCMLLHAAVRRLHVRLSFARARAGEDQ